MEEIPKRILKKVELVLVDYMDSVLKEALVLGEGEELLAPEEECEPFSIEPDRESEPAPPEVTAH
jgi:ATP-dependent Lon protease